MDEKQTIEYCEECLSRFKSGRLHFEDIQLELMRKSPNLAVTANVLEHFGVTSKVEADEAATYAKDKGAALYEHLRNNVSLDGVKIAYEACEMRGYSEISIRFVFEGPDDHDMDHDMDVRTLKSIMAPYEYTDEHLFILYMLGRLDSCQVYDISRMKGGRITEISNTNKRFVGFYVDPNSVNVSSSQRKKPEMLEELRDISKDDAWMLTYITAHMLKDPSCIRDIYQMLTGDDITNMEEANNGID